MKKRVFAAIEINTRAKRRVLSYIDNLRIEFPKNRVGWDSEEKLHLTLKFFGNVEFESINDLIKNIEMVSAGFSNFILQIAGTGVFPNQRKAKILWLGIADEKCRLTELIGLLEKEFSKTGFPVEKRKFKPHLTIARLREPDKSFELVKKHLTNNFEPIEFEVCSIALIESKLFPTGSVYIPIHQTRFG